ncbi:hypothetical protein [Paenibacillus jamilae]|uniref:hypothetical protein n=1 Tax=Paenibacillus jamilae TaxID=114136 RepID=UPI0018D2BFE0|nr:hypothetical protein [Paenibacillus jamilae]
MVEKLDWLSESLATVITNIAYTSWKHLSDEQKELVKVAFHKKNQKVKIAISSNILARLISKSSQHKGK